MLGAMGFLHRLFAGLVSLTLAVPASSYCSGTLGNRKRMNHLIQKGGATIVGACPERSRRDGDGNRVKKVVAGVTTTYLVDTLNPTGYAQVVFESFSGSSSGNRELKHSYVYGLELISQTRSYVANFNSATQKIYYVYDGHGSVRALTDPTGAVTDTYLR
jgi:hypothetical protein